MAWLNENMIMRNRTHGGYKVLLDELWEICEEFRADTVILWEHMACKALDGMHGLFEEKARAFEMDLTEFSRLSLKAKNVIPITAQCTVFAESEVISLVGEGKPIDPQLMGALGAAEFANVICITAIITRAVKTKTNPYKKEIWVGTKDFEEAMARR